MLFLCCYSWSGPATQPAMAEAAATTGLARYTSELRLPMAGAMPKATRSERESYWTPNSLAVLVSRATLPSRPSMYLAGFGLGWVLGRWRASRPGSGWTAPDVDDLLTCVMIGIILGGRIGYVLFYDLPVYINDPMIF